MEEQIESFRRRDTIFTMYREIASNATKYFRPVPGSEAS